jgi:uncharacterized protein YhaN
MFIRELQLDGYGALQALKLPFDAPVTVIYGPNEAGKSTVLRFVRSLLYGFPTRKDLVERGEPMFGGRHGGRMRFTNHSGQEYSLERYADKGNGLVLREMNGDERLLGQAEWERLMLGGISERLFRQLFAVSLNELHELRTLQGEEIGNYLYHAGLAGGSALTAARRQINAEMDRLFRPRGTTHEMNRVLASMKELEISIRQSKDNVQTYNETKDDQYAAEQQLVQLEQQLPILRRQVTSLQGAYELREWWLRREALTLEQFELRKQLPDPELPLLLEDRINAWTDLKKSRDEVTDQLEKAHDRMLELQELRGRLSWEERLAATQPEWERLESLREGMIARREEVVELGDELRMQDETIQSILSRISVDWGETELQAFGGMAAQRERIRRLQQAIEQAERTTLGLQADVRKVIRQQEVLQAEAGSAERQARNKQLPESVPENALPFGLFIPRTRAALLQVWHNVEDARRAYDRVRTRIQPVANRPNRSSHTRRSTTESSSRLLYFIAGILSVMAIVLYGLTLGEDQVQPLLYGIAVVLILLSIGLVIVAIRRRMGAITENPASGLSADSEEITASLKSQRKRVMDSLNQLINDPETAAAKLVPDDSELNRVEQSQHSDSEDTMWSQLREAVYEQLGRLEDLDRGQSKQLELEERRQELQLEKELLERDMVHQQEQMNELNMQWQQWLQTYKLPVHFIPESLPELIGLAEQGQVVLRQRQRVQERLGHLQRIIEEFEQSVIPLLEHCAVPAALRKDVMQAVHWHYRESTKQLAVQEEAGQLDREWSAAKTSAAAIQARLTGIEDEARKLFDELHSGSEGELEQRIRIDERCLVLQKEAREIRLRLEAGRDLEARSQLYELLEAHDEAALASLLQEQKTRLDEVESARTELLERRGRLSQELDRLRTDVELEDKGFRLGELQSKLEQLSERYAILALSDQLIVQTKAVFEEEKQPEVLQRSSRYFHQMTNGIYTRVIAPGDTPALLAETQDNRLIDSAFLSRGTQEQLYLAMRFALCHAASPENPLPLLLDDLFVHFDEERLTHTLPVLGELAGTRQLLLFTCHARVAQTIAEGLPSARVLTLPARGA